MAILSEKVEILAASLQKALAALRQARDGEEVYRKVRMITAFDALQKASAIEGVEAFRKCADAMNRFCDRVELGSIRSRRTYAEFCEILGREPKQ